MLTKKIVAIIGIILSLNLLLVPTTHNIAKAYADYLNFGANLPTSVFTGIQSGSGAASVPLQSGDLATNTAGTGGIFTQIGMKLEEFISNNLAGIAFTAVKVAALKVVQIATQKIIGKGGGGGVVTDWNSYLYNNPRQVAMTQMTSFFNTVSKGRSSVLNYEGVGPNYDGYLIGQAKKAIEGQALTTNLQAYATDPTQLYAAGNFKGMSTLGECGNNVPCYTMMSQTRYATELSKATTVADKEQNAGVLPQKINGKISQPAVLLTTALSQVDQQGERLIMDAKADTKDGYAGAAQQIIAGMAISTLARTMNYATSDAKGKAAARKKNDSFPFSIAYSSNSATGGQLSVGAGGTVISTNANNQKLGGSTLDNLGSNLMNTATQTAISTACAGLAANSPVRLPSGITTKCPAVINKAIN